MKCQRLFCAVALTSSVLFGVIGESYAQEVQSYKVVAHRGGFMECQLPDCSLASLAYAADLHCYASECDILLTADGEVLVAHPEDGCLVNGLTSYDHTLSQIREAGKLANGETLPTLRQFIEFLQDPEKNPAHMRLWIDVKWLVKERKYLDMSYSVNACLQACKIIEAMHAQDLCEFLIPQRKGLFEALYDRVINEYGINMAWMACVSPDRYGKAWAQLAYNRICKADAPYGPQDYLSAGVTLSIYNVNDDDSMNAVLPYYPRLKAIFTNYPAMLIQKLKDQGYVQ